MTPPEDLVRLRHLREAAEKAIEFTAGKTRDDLDADEVLRLALTKLVEIVPWAAAARMRDRLVHHYFDVDLDVLWATIVQDLPALISMLPGTFD